ncbi:MAG: LamG domain-containing protein [Fibrobacterota bacterium]|nr:LamG domain-containing protein [Fibrobacterota bacterium]
MGPTEGNGSISFSFGFEAASPFKAIAKSADIMISAPDMVTMNRTLEIKDSTIEGTVTGIPAGKNRTFELQVYDSAGNVRYRGNSKANINVNSLVAVKITVHRLLGSAVINGNVVEAPIELKDSATMVLFNFDEGTGAQTVDSKNNVIGILNNVTWTKSPLGFATTFNGTNSHITTSSSPFVTLQDTFTIDILFRVETTTERRMLFGMRQPQDVSAEVRDDGRFRAVLHDGNESTHLVSLGRVDDGKWHAVSILHRKDFSTLYLDGVKQKDSTNTNLHINTSTHILIGHNQLAEFPGRFFFKGDIELIRFSKVARSEAEVVSLSSLIGN